MMRRTHSLIVQSDFDESEDKSKILRRYARRTTGSCAFHISRRSSTPKPDWSSESGMQQFDWRALASDRQLRDVERLPAPRSHTRSHMRGFSGPDAHESHSLRSRVRSLLRFASIPKGHAVPLAFDGRTNHRLADPRQTVNGRFKTGQTDASGVQARFLARSTLPSVCRFF